MTSQPTSPSDEDGDELEFPDFYPDDCPYEDAKRIGDDGMVFYRNVLSNPATAMSFLDHVVMGGFEGACECKRRSLSVFTDKNESELFAKKYKEHGRFVARISVKDKHGVYLDTPSRRKHPPGKSHKSWWRAVGVIGSELVTECEEIEEDE